MEFLYTAIDYLYKTSIYLSSVQYLGLVTIILSAFYAYKRFSIYSYLFIFTLYFLSKDYGCVFWVSYIFAASFITIRPLRRFFITSNIIRLIKILNLLPKISQSEKIALTTGNIWIDADLFSGRPNFNKILSYKYPKLSKKEADFLNNEVEELCKICSDYEVQKLRDLPEKVWKFLKNKKFFGMIIPKKYGGLEFSAYGHSCVIEKLSSRSVPLAITAMVPNSLGPAELLLHYGTKKQQDYYLPRLAKGIELPCFALTEPEAGSDATSIKSEGVLFKNKKGEIKIRLNFEKRYITLGAYATLIGVAFQLKDPENLIFDHEDVGITCALVPNKTKGVKQGRRHDPLATPFVNSPLNGKDVEISVDDVIGGKKGLGIGWQMLMDCLSAGRGISLPSTSSGGSKLVARVTSIYAILRKQFGLSIAKFEGIEEVLARIAGRTYALDAMRSFTASAIDLGFKPSAITAIAKYHSTEIFRQNINDGMDIIGGRGIIRGPRNILANAYFSTPISITVEGANIITRSLIHFGQGAMMCHPYIYQEIEALQNNDIDAFDRNLFAHIKHLISNFARSVILSTTRGYFRKPFKVGFIAKYERKLSWCSATFAFLSDIAIAKFGGNLKRKEKLNGRFGDILSAMYISSCILRKFKNQSNSSTFSSSDIALAEYAIKEQLEKAQYAFERIYQNLFSNFTRSLIWPFALFARLNFFMSPRSDKLEHKIVKALISDDKYRDKLTDGIYTNQDPKDNLGRLENALIQERGTSKITNKIKQAITNKILEKEAIETLLEKAVKKSIITASEKKIFIQAQKDILDAMQVDEYSLSEYKKI